MLASLAFPYTLDTGETITEGMGMECLTADHTPRTDPRHNLVITAPPYKTRGGSTIAQGGLFPYKNSHARTLGKLTIEPVDVGGPKLAKPWVHCPMGIVPLAGVVRALWASGRDILGRCGTSVRGRFGPVSETIRGPQAPCCAGRAARPVGGLKPCVVPPYAASWSGVVMVAWWAR